MGRDWDFALCGSVPEIPSLTDPLGTDLGKIMVISEVAVLQTFLGIV